MTHRVADELVSRLVEAGVKRIYGIVGDSLNPVTDAIRRNGKLQWIHVRHEETAAFAAGAEAQLSGKLTACAGSCGPGSCIPRSSARNTSLCREVSNKSSAMDSNATTFDSKSARL